MTFETIHKEYFRPLCYFSEKMIGERCAAEDIVGDIFEKLFNKFGDFENEKAIKSWLYVTAKNSCIDYLRKEKRRREIEKQEGFYYVTEERTVLDYMMESDVLKEISRDIDKLSPAEKKILTLWFVDKMEINEIATHLGLSVKTVRNQKANAINHLKLGIYKKEFYE